MKLIVKPSLENYIKEPIRNTILKCVEFLLAAL